MRSMLVSLSPKECVNLLNGDLSILIRKIKPKCDLPIDVYIYCTKEGGCIGVDIGKQKYFYLKKAIFGMAKWLQSSRLIRWKK